MRPTGYQGAKWGESAQIESRKKGGRDKPAQTTGRKKAVTAPGGEASLQRPAPHPEHAALLPVTTAMGGQCGEVRCSGAGGHANNAARPEW